MSYMVDGAGLYNHCHKNLYKAPGKESFKNYQPGPLGVLKLQNLLHLCLAVDGRL